MAQLTFLGHSAWLIQTNQYQIVIDPFLKGNPQAKIKPENLKADFIIVTHAHGDHLGDAIPMSKASNGLIIANNEIANYCIARGAKAHNMHIGGTREFPFGRVKLTPAWHGSSFPDGSYGGMPTGCLVMIEGKTIYHTGDTGLFSDMQLIGEMNPVDVLLVSIGDNFTMGVDDAVRAVEFVKPKLTIPMHYNTFDVIKANANEFKQKVAAKGYKVELVGIGESYQL